MTDPAGHPAPEPAAPAPGRTVGGNETVRRAEPADAGHRVLRRAAGAGRWACHAAAVVAGAVSDALGDVVGAAVDALIEEGR